MRTTSPATPHPASPASSAPTSFYSPIMPWRRTLPVPRPLPRYPTHSSCLRICLHLSRLDGGSCSCLIIKKQLKAASQLHDNLNLKPRLRPHYKLNPCPACPLRLSPNPCSSKPSHRIASSRYCKLLVACQAESLSMNLGIIVERVGEGKAG